MLEIRNVRTDQEALHAGELARDFVGWLRDRYPERTDEITQYLVTQKFDEQVKDLRAYYTPPKGECLLALDQGQPVGLLMLKDIGDGICEMNRMFVRDTERGMGVGSALIAELGARAREMGFHRMLLGALPRHKEALALYHKTGFRPDERAKSTGVATDGIYLGLDL